MRRYFVTQLLSNTNQLSIVRESPMRLNPGVGGGGGGGGVIYLCLDRDVPPVVFKADPI